MRTRIALSPSLHPASRRRFAPRFAGANGSRSARRSGFTLLELLVVMSIGTLIAAITLGGFTQLGASQKRTTCQTNMTQLYQAARLYQADEGGFPYYNPTGSTPADRNIGLWALYTFPDFANTNGIRAASDEPIFRYLKSINTLHCPQDSEDGHDQRTTSGGTVFNTDFLSYQVKDPDGGPNDFTYLSVRDDSRPPSSNLAATMTWQRQLEPRDGATHVLRPPADDTVVTWCPWHRAAAGSRQYDNVLFYDGSVQLIPRIDQNGKTGWLRTRRAPL